MNGPEAPRDSEWTSYQRSLLPYGRAVTIGLVHTLGGGPNPAQRQETIKFRQTHAFSTLRYAILTDVAFHRAIYRLSGNPVIEETITPQWPHMRRSMATVQSELDYRGSAWAEHADIAGHILAGDAKAAERAALAHAQTAGRMTEERLRATEEAAA
jgi:DNA-binding GntR family transcriptional regulator